MTSHLYAVCFAAADPERLANFWSALLGAERAEGRTRPGPELTLLPAGDTGLRISFVATPEPKAGQNRAHFDLTSASAAEQERTVARALDLGARHIDVGQTPEDGHVVLADPEGNEFCVIEAGNKFLADTGFVGALSCDGSQRVGYFWSAALGWPLVWDQDQETAIQSPRGGPKITWGGPPLSPRHGRDRVWLDLTPDGDADTEVGRLLALGATRADTGRGGPGRVELADPDGNVFRVVTPG